MIPNLFRGVYQIRTDDQGVAVPRLTTWLRRLILSYSSNPMVFWVSFPASQVMQAIGLTYQSPLVPRGYCNPCFASIGAASQSRTTSLTLVATGPSLTPFEQSHGVTPRVGLEPTTLRLTAECSTIELSRNDQDYFVILLINRRWRDLNPRAAQTTYTLSRGASSAT